MSAGPPFRAGLVQLRAGTDMSRNAEAVCGFVREACRLVNAEMPNDVIVTKTGACWRRAIMVLLYLPGDLGVCKNVFFARRPTPLITEHPVSATFRRMRKRAV